MPPTFTNIRVVADQPYAVRSISAQQPFILRIASIAEPPLIQRPNERLVVGRPPTPFAGEPRGIVGGKKNCDARDVVRLSDATQRSARDHRLLEIAAHKAGSVRTFGLDFAEAIAFTRIFRGPNTSARRACLFRAWPPDLTGLYEPPPPRAHFMNATSTGSARTSLARSGRAKDRPSRVRTRDRAT
jgi:hypothetical protein